MRNITKDIKKAIATDTLWSVNEFHEFLIAATNKGFKVGYDYNEDNWAVISLNNNNAGYIWQKYPLLIFSQGYITTVTTLLADYSFLVSIAVSDLTADELVVNSDQDFFDRFHFMCYDQPISASSLWFYTVT
jgi:hypothetical protein